jgi:hypothetical protein
MTELLSSSTAMEITMWRKSISGVTLVVTTGVTHCLSGWFMRSTATPKTSDGAGNGTRLHPNRAERSSMCHCGARQVSLWA